MTIDRNMIWQETKDYFNITLGLMLYTFGFTVFLLPYQIVTGGIAGIGAIIFYTTKFPVQWTFFIINALLIARFGLDALKITERRGQREYPLRRLIRREAGANAPSAGLLFPSEGR